ncbi:hypothetical protein DYB26_003968 [Aphanomyces astaci]|uniref:Uncharacterized protein n=1 Tax=Aphanomyces astaci TaxID=112090 RepID=A0A3R6YPR6_APHAT|nr:hypothetical protein DYB26_003968 [Aphanomyces astaci]
MVSFGSVPMESSGPARWSGGKVLLGVSSEDICGGWWSTRLVSGPEGFRVQRGHLAEAAFLQEARIEGVEGGTGSRD